MHTHHTCLVFLYLNDTFTEALCKFLHQLLRNRLQYCDIWHQSICCSGFTNTNRQEIRTYRKQAFILVCRKEQGKLSASNLSGHQNPFRYEVEASYCDPNLDSKRSNQELNVFFPTLAEDEEHNIIKSRTCRRKFGMVATNSFHCVKLHVNFLRRTPEDTM